MYWWHLLLLFCIIILSNNKPIPFTFRLYPLTLHHGSTPPHPPSQEMERIFLGIFYVILSGVLWVFGGDTSGALCGASKGEAVYVVAGR